MRPYVIQENARSQQTLQQCWLNMLGRRLRRRSNIGPTLVQRFYFAGMFNQCCFHGWPASLNLKSIVESYRPIIIYD